MSLENWLKKDGNAAIRSQLEYDKKRKEQREEYEKTYYKYPKIFCQEFEMKEGKLVAIKGSAQEGSSVNIIFGLQSSPSVYVHSWFNYGNYTTTCTSSKEDVGKTIDIPNPCIICDNTDLSWETGKIRDIRSPAPVLFQFKDKWLPGYVELRKADEAKVQTIEKNSGVRTSYVSNMSKLKGNNFVKNDLIKPPKDYKKLFEAGFGKDFDEFYDFVNLVYKPKSGEQISKFLKENLGIFYNPTPDHINVPTESQEEDEEAPF